MNTQFEYRGVSANTESLNHKVVQLDRALKITESSSRLFTDEATKTQKKAGDSPKDTEPGKETIHIQFPRLILQDAMNRGTPWLLQIPAARLLKDDGLIDYKATKLY